MASRRALISKDDLDRMATTVAAHGVIFKGRVDALGNFTFAMEPKTDRPSHGNDDLDGRLDEWGAL